MEKLGGTPAAWMERDRSAGRGGGTVKRGNSLGGAPLQAARSMRRTMWTDGEAYIAWGSSAGGSEIEAPARWTDGA